MKLALETIFYSLKRYFYHICAGLVRKGATGAFLGKFSKFALGITPLKAYFSALKNLPKMLTEKTTIKRRISKSRFVSIVKEYGINAKKVDYIQ